MNPLINLEGRVATVADAAQLAAMNQQLIRDEGHRNPMSLTELEERMTRWLDGEYEVILFDVAGSAVGYAVYKHEDEWTYLRQLFVLPEFWAVLFGTALLEIGLADRSHHAAIGAATLRWLGEEA